MPRAILAKEKEAIKAIARRGPRKRKQFFLWIAVAMSFTAFFGFSFTYFGPLFRGAYPEVSPMVHVHGWAFFAWYLLLPMQAGMIRARKVKLHRTLGLSSIVLAVLMVITGLVVVAVQIDLALAPDGSPFWAFMGLPIFSLLVAFAIFYTAAIRTRRHGAYHKRFMVLASAAALSAATFRIFLQILGGGEQWIWVVGFSAPILFVFAAMIYDYRHGGAIHQAYRWGVPVMIGVIGGAFLVGMMPGGESVHQGVAWVGRALGFLY